MPRDPLDAVLRIRRMAVDAARRHLADSLTIEEAARKRVAAAEARIESEAAVAADLATGDAAVEAFAAWLPVGRAIVGAAQAEHEKALTDVNMARAAVTVARASAAAAADLQSRRAADRAALAERRAQNAMDEVASRVRSDGEA
jgi:hypothetical protein